MWSRVGQAVIGAMVLVCDRTPKYILHIFILCVHMIHRRAAATAASTTPAAIGRFMYNLVCPIFIFLCEQTDYHSDAMRLLATIKYDSS